MPATTFPRPGPRCRPRQGGGRHLVALVAIAAAAIAPAGAVATATAEDLPEYSIGELIELDVSLAARRPQRLQETAAAVSVLTADQIRRSGARSIPELLRVVPGLAVADLGDGNWAVAVRGFNGRFSNKLQVLIDGRSVYSPLFSGVFWSTVDYPLDDIERIEVIRGPGAVMWGANAMNGVINIVTRKARDTQGNAVTVVADSPRAGALSARSGVMAGDTTALRVYAKAESLATAPALLDGARTDSGERYSTGVRVDGGDAAKRWSFDGQALSVDQSERWAVPAYAAPWAQIATVGARVTQGNVQFRHEWGAAQAPDVVVRFSAETSRVEFTPYVTESRTTVDGDLQWRLRPASGNELLLGAAFRSSRDSIAGSSLIGFSPERQTYNVASVFAHDEIALDSAGRLDVGLRLEHNTYNGLLPQGGLRWVFTPAPQHTLWASIARAVRTPSRAELGARIDTYLYPPGAFLPGPLPVLASIRPHQEFDVPAETLDEIDVGWRANIAGKAWFDVAAFAGRYRDLVMSRLGVPTLAALPAHVVIPVVTDVRGRGRTAGIELAAEWEIAPGLRVNGRYSFLDLDIERPGNPAGDMLAATYTDCTPRHQWGVGIVWDPAPRWKLDLRLRGVAGLAADALPGYAAVDVRVGHKPLRNLEFELVVRNLGAGPHVEMQSTFLPALPLEIEPSVGVGLRWSF